MHVTFDLYESQGMGQARSGHKLGPVRSRVRPRQGMVRPSQHCLVRAARRQYNSVKAAADSMAQVRQGVTLSCVAAKRPLAYTKLTLQNQDRPKKGVCSLGYALHSTPAQLELHRVVLGA